MKSKQEPTQTQETPWQPLSPEQRTSGIEWLEKTKADLRPASKYPAIQLQTQADEGVSGSSARSLAARKAVAEEENERYKKEMDGKRRYNSGVAALCGFLGGFVVPILIGREVSLDDRWLAILCSVGLSAGWVLGAVYIYPLFYHKNGTAKPHLVWIEGNVQKWRPRMCAAGLHSWDKWIHTKTCRVCGKRQII
jgi:hypothetical protein